MHERRTEIIVDVSSSALGASSSVRLVPTPKRKTLLDIVTHQPGRSVSKILNTQGYRLRDLRYVVADAER